MTSNILRKAVNSFRSFKRVYDGMQPSKARVATQQDNIGWDLQTAYSYQWDDGIENIEEELNDLRKLTRSR